ncbi:hypothetical protein [Rhodoferax sp. GW822-FHT02A01]|uniref:hypothetical protein n=1 Tax=Rhodoferax sp. GW822-FHT02A01 TaxID=3141537 RepID=UPI00315C59B8
MTKAKKGKSNTVRSERTTLPPTPLTPLAKGLTTICVRDAALIPQVRCTIEHLILTKSARLGVPMPEVAELISLHAGTIRSIEYAKVLSAANHTKEGVGPVHKHKVFQSPGGFNWTGPEGLSVVLPLIEKATGCVTLEQPTDRTLSGLSAEGMFRIRAASTQAGVWTILFMSHPEGHEKSGIHRVCDEYFEVTRCDPDPGWESAFAVDCIDLSRSNDLDLGKVMCNVKFIEGKMVRRYEKFVSVDLKIRLMAHLRGQKMTMEEIGRIAMLDKSQVSRSLKGIRPLVSATWDDDMQRKWLEACELPEVPSAA